jgi:hypothetical protein
LNNKHHQSRIYRVKAAFFHPAGDGVVFSSGGDFFILSLRFYDGAYFAADRRAGGG